MKTLRCVAAQGLRLLADCLDARYAARYKINVVHAEQIQPDVRRITYDLQRQMGT